MFESGFKFNFAFCILLALSFNGVEQTEASPIDFTRDLTPSQLKNSIEVNIDNVIDENIDFIRGSAEKMDPLSIDDTRVSVTNHIYMDLSNGWLQDLAKIGRSGPCILRYTSSNTQKTITANLNLGWDNLVFDYRYFMKIILGHRRGDLHGQFTKLKLRVIVDIDLNKYKLILKKLEIIDTGKITIKLEGHLTDKICNLAIKAATKILKNLIIKAINKKISEMLEYQNAGALMDVQNDLYEFADVVEQKNKDLLLH